MQEKKQVNSFVMQKGRKTLLTMTWNPEAIEKKKDCEFNYQKQSKDFLKDENSTSKSKKQITNREKQLQPISQIKKLFIKSNSKS